QNAEAQPPAGAGFPPLDRWIHALREGDANAMKAMYSLLPPAEISTRAGKVDANSEVNFWTGLSAKDLTVQVAQSSSSQPDVEQLFIQADSHPPPSEGKPSFVPGGLVCKKQVQSGLITMGKRPAAPRLEQPASTKKDIYPAGVDAHAEIKEAEEKAA